MKGYSKAEEICNQKKINKYAKNEKRSKTNNQREETDIEEIYTNKIDKNIRNEKVEIKRLVREENNEEGNNLEKK